MLKTIILYCHYFFAFQCQEQYKIPASIQLAQAMLESGYGQSNVAKQSNNCFGILAFSNWKGDVYRVNKNLAFRKYDSIHCSYKDHAQFMAYHYESAVGKNWKYWVTNCKGYAAHNSYWKVLEKLIIDYKLDRFDTI